MNTVLVHVEGGRVEEVFVSGGDEFIVKVVDIDKELPVSVQTGSTSLETGEILDKLHSLIKDDIKKRIDYEVDVDPGTAGKPFRGTIVGLREEKDNDDYLIKVLHPEGRVREVHFDEMTFVR